MMKMIVRVVSLVTALPLLLLACETPLDPSTCEYEATRSAALEAAHLDAVQVLAGAGALEVVGRADADSVRVHSRACASSPDLLRQVDVTMDRAGDVAEVDALLPDAGGHALLDLVIEVPARLAIQIQDGSGEVEVRDVASLEVTDGSGPLEIESVSGDVSLDDGSGPIEVARVSGTVRIVDGSGDLRAEDVQGDLWIDRDGSGDIYVADVAGDFRVDEDGSGDIEFERIGGIIEIP